LPQPGCNGNGAPAAPTITGLDSDGTLEIPVQTFDHGLDIFILSGSAAKGISFFFSLYKPHATLFLLLGLREVLSEILKYFCILFVIV
jgi:hypothetical protein